MKIFLKKIKEGKFLDNEISSDAIIDPFIPGVYRLYFCSVAIDQSHSNHKIEIFSLLYKSFFDKLKQWADKNFYIEEIIADAVTQDGRKISQSFGLTKQIDTNHLSTLYYSKMLPPKFKGTKEAEIVFKKYKDYFDSFNK
jgi:DNA-binding transcriptional ArsR family regulator